jgi:hypothetical protein
MVKYINKYFQITLLILLASITPIDCSQQPWYAFGAIEIIKLNLRIFFYRSNTAAIDMLFELRSMIQRPYMKIDPQRHVVELQKKLLLMGKNLRIAERDHIYRIAKKNGLNDEQIERLFQELKHLKASYKEFLNNPDHCSHHDMSIPEENIACIKQTLSRAQLSANNIHLLNSCAFTGLVAETVGEFGFGIVENDAGGELYVHRFDKISILFHPNLYDHSPIVQSAVCMHEARHVIEGHTLSNAFVQFFISKKTLNTEVDCQQLLQIEEREADILPAIQDKEAALFMRLKRSRDYYEGKLYEKHYVQLSDIDETHKMITYLENIK